MYHRFRHHRAPAQQVKAPPAPEAPTQPKAPVAGRRSKRLVDKVYEPVREPRTTKKKKGRLAPPPQPCQLCNFVGTGANPWRSVTDHQIEKHFPEKFQGPFNAPFECETCSFLAKDKHGLVRHLAACGDTLESLVFAELAKNLNIE